MNWRFSRESDHPVLARIYGVFLGVSVQAYSEPLPLPAIESTPDGLQPLKFRFYKIIGARIMETDGDSHYYNEPGNFGVVDGHLVFVNYASVEVQSVDHTQIIWSNSVSRGMLMT